MDGTSAALESLRRCSEKQKSTLGVIKQNRASTLLVLGLDLTSVPAGLVTWL